MTYKPKHRADTPDDIAMREYAERRRLASERNKVKYAPFEKSFCQEFSDLMDGFVIHAPTCSRYQHTAISGTDCVNLRYVRTWPIGLGKVR